MEITKCPACSSSKCQIIDSYTDKIEIIAKEYRFVQQPYNINKCIDCGLHYKSDILSPEEFSLYYTNVDFKGWSYERLYPPERVIKKYLEGKPVGKRILDFGCSEGRLLASLVNDYECYGFDLNAEALKVAKSKGISIFEDLDKLLNCGMQFDFIIMVDVFEHLLTPTQVIDSLQKLLKKGGELVISTGSANAPAYLKKPAEFWYFINPQHVCMLSNEFIHYLCSRNNLSVCFKDFSSHYDIPVGQKIKIYIVFYSYWYTLNMRKISFLHRLYPFNKIFKWKLYPHFPVTKDHVIVALKNN